MLKKMLIKIFKITALTLIIFMSYCANFINGYTDETVVKVKSEGIFVAVGDNGSTFYSTDGINWSGPNTVTGTPTLNSVTYGNGKFIAVAEDIYTYDGVNWKQIYGPSPAGFNKINYSNGIYFLCGNNGIFYSTDGINWSIGTGTSGILYSATHGDGKFITVGKPDTGNNVIFYSDDGKNWQSANYTSDNFKLNSVTYGNGKFVAVGDNGAAYYSNDGINWDGPNIITGTPTLKSVTYGDGKFVAVGDNGAQGRAFYSLDGINWIAVGDVNPFLGGGNSLNSVTYGNGKFAAVGVGGTIYYSYDGVNWSSGNGLSGDINGVTFSKTSVEFPG